MNIRRWVGLTARGGLVFLGVMVLVACGDAGAGTGSDGGTGTFTATVSGARTATVGGEGYFICRSSPNEFEIASDFAFTNVVAIYIPNTTSAGDTVDLTALGTSANYVGNSISTDYFDTVESGTITLTAVPTTPGQAIAGTFSFTANDGTRAPSSVTVSGTFDFPATDASFSDCS